MGASQSVHLSLPKNFNLFSIMFCSTNKLRLLAAPPEIILKTKTILQTSWPIEKINEQAGFIEFKLGQKPFNGNRISDIHFKYLMCSLLKGYYSIGWHFKVSTNLQRRHCKSSTMIFEKDIELSTYVISLSLHGNDKIRVFAPKDVVQYIKTVIVSHWPFGIQRERMIGKSWEFQLKQNPWSSYSSDRSQSFFSTSMINSVMKLLYHQGWVNIGAVKSGKRRYDLNALYFRFDQALRDINTNSEPSQFIAISLNKIDKIRLINAPFDLANVVRTALLRNWPKGIAKETLKNGAYEFQLRGDPWWCHGVDTVDSRRLISGILTLLKQTYWDLYATCVLTMNLSAKSVFFFRHDPTGYTKESSITCVSLNESDKIRIMNCSDAHVSAVGESIHAGWPKGIKNKFCYGRSIQFQLNGHPFNGDYAYLIYTSVITMFIISNLERENLKLLCSAFVSGKYRDFSDKSYSKGLSSFYFVEQ
jgi:hypothetical protein